MGKYPNPYELSEEDKQYVRDHCTKISIETIARNIYKPRSEVMKLVLSEKLSINVIKNYHKKQNV